MSNDNTAAALAHRLQTLDEKAHKGDAHAAEQLCQEGQKLVSSPQSYRDKVLQRLKSADPALSRQLLNEGTFCSDGSIQFEVSDVTFKGASTPEKFADAIADGFAKTKPEDAAQYLQHSLYLLRDRFPEAQALKVRDEITNRLLETGANPYGYWFTADSGGRLAVSTDNKRPLSIVNLGDPHQTAVADTVDKFADGMFKNVVDMTPEEAGKYSLLASREFSRRFAGSGEELSRLMNEKFRESNDDGTHYWTSIDHSGNVKLHPIVATTATEFGQAVAREMRGMGADEASAYFRAMAEDFRSTFPQTEAGVLQKALNQGFSGLPERTRFHVDANDKGVMTLISSRNTIARVNTGDLRSTNVAQTPKQFAEAMGANMQQMSPDEAAAYFEGLARRYGARFPDKDSSDLAKGLYQSFDQGPKRFLAGADSDGHVPLFLADKKIATASLGAAFHTAFARTPSEYSEGMGQAIMDLKRNEIADYFEGKVHEFHRRFPDEKIGTLQRIMDLTLRQAQGGGGNDLHVATENGRMILRSLDGKKIYAAVKIDS